MIDEKIKSNPKNIEGIKELEKAGNVDLKIFRIYFLTFYFIAMSERLMSSISSGFWWLFCLFIRELMVSLIFLLK